jgi:hypothetical protein
MLNEEIKNLTSFLFHLDTCTSIILNPQVLSYCTSMWYICNAEFDLYYFRRFLLLWDVGQLPTSFGLPSDANFNNHLSCHTIGNERTSW